MPHLALVDATDLEAWASRREAQSVLPLLIRRLIHVTVHDATRIGFPAGDAVQQGGWDGILETVNGNAFAPSGLSVWEFGTNRNIKGKADEDYEKRKGNPLGVVPSEATFIFVTPRRWNAKDRWINEKKAEGVWRDVRVYDADSIEEWLGDASSVHLWLSTKLGRFHDDAEDLATAWQNWAGCTAPVMTPSIILAGREFTSSEIYRWLGDTEVQQLPLGAGTRDEALAVFASSIAALPLDEQDAVMARTAVVRSSQALRQLATNLEPLILVVSFAASAEALTGATRQGHRIVMPLGRDDAMPPSAIVVPPLSIPLVTQELRTAGVPEGQARQAASLARRSLTAFRRQFGQTAIVQTPDWANGPNGPSLLPALVAGAWQGNIAGDREVMETLARVQYPEWIQALTTWAVQADPPVKAVGDVWYLVSKEDAWHLLARYLTPETLAVLEAVILRELINHDPRLDLPVEERWWSQQRPHISTHLRNGLVETLVILGTRNDVIGPARAQDFVNNCVRQLLARANADWKLWATLPLRLLAEAAPDVFLEAVEDGLRGDDPVLSRLFETGGDPLFSTSPHTYLLWALELLAWSPAHLARAAIALAHLARLDPGGKTTNRPSESLYQIFVFWHHQTAASFEDRIAILDRIRRQEPDVAWTLLASLLPSMHGSASGNPVPLWRDWASNANWRDTTRIEIDNGTREVVPRMVDDAGIDGARWCVLIEALDDLPEEQLNLVLERLRNLRGVELPDEALTRIWCSLQSVISKHRSYSEAAWALPEDVLQRMVDVHHLLEPRNLVNRMAWLFGDQAPLLEGREQDYRERDRIVDERRTSAVREVWETQGMQGILALAMAASTPWFVGTTTGLNLSLSPEQEDATLVENLASEDWRLTAFAEGFVRGRAGSQGETWYEAVIARLWLKLASSQQAKFLLSLPSNPRTLDLAESSPETEAEFWRKATPRFVGPELHEKVVNKLMQHGRPFTAIEILDRPTQEEGAPSPAFILQTLRNLVHAEVKDDNGSGFTYHLSKLLAKLEASPEVSEDEIAMLEWALLPALGRHGHGRPPANLHRQISRNPEFFVQLICLVYLAEGEEPRELPPEDLARYENAFDLLENWRKMPGSADHGNTIDTAALLQWTHRARALLDEAGRLGVGDRQIGTVLAYAPKGDDDIWPHPAIREVIEDVRSPELERGFCSGTYFKRGVTSRGLTEGGAQERELAATYNRYAEALRGTAPRTAAALKQVAERYLTEANREDQGAELREDLGI